MKNDPCTGYKYVWGKIYDLKAYEYYVLLWSSRRIGVFPKFWNKLHLHRYRFIELHIKHSSLLYNFFSLTGVCSNNHNSFLYFIFGPCFRLVSLIIFLNVIIYINMHFCIDCHQVPKKAALCMNIPFRITLSRDNKC